MLGYNGLVGHRCYYAAGLRVYGRGLRKENRGPVVRAWLQSHESQVCPVSAVKQYRGP